MRSTRATVLLVLGSTLTLAPPASAQRLCVELPPPTVTETMQVMLTLSATRNGKAVAGNEAEQSAVHTVLAALRRAVDAPPGALPVITPSMRFARVDSARSLYTPLVSHEFTFVLDGDGAVRDVQRESASIDLAADSAFGARIAAVADSSLRSAARALGPDTRLRVTTHFVRAGETREVTWAETPLHERELPLYRGTELRPLPVDQGPRYPRTRTGNVEKGYAWASFAVGPDGRVDPKSLKIFDATAPEFGDATRAWIATLRFKPQTIEGCAIRGWAGVPVHFSR